MTEDIKIKPDSNKSRFSHRGEKKRYSVFKAEYNQKWLPIEEQKVKSMCEKYDLEPEQFLRDTDNKNRKWYYAGVRCIRYIKNLS